MHKRIEQALFWAILGVQFEISSLTVRPGWWPESSYAFGGLLTWIGLGYVLWLRNPFYPRKKPDTAG